MWKRFKRVMRSFAGWFVSLGEDPELILKQNIRDLEDQIPQLNEGLAQIVAQKHLAERELQKAQEKENELAAKIKAALKAQKRDIALNYAAELETTKAAKTRAQTQVKIATESHERAEKARRAFLVEAERKRKEALEALNEKRRAEWSEKVAGAMANFDIAGIDATHDEMVRKIEEKAVRSDAKLEMALDSVKVDKMEIEAEAKNIQANETLRQFEIELGMVNDASGAPQAVAAKEKTIGPQEREKA